MEGKHRKKTTSKAKNAGSLKDRLKKIPLPWWIGGGVVLAGLIVLIVVLCLPKKTPAATPAPAAPTGNYLFSGGMAAVKLEGNWGYINEKGTVVVTAKYEDAKPFRENGMAAVKQNGKWGYVNSLGVQVIECIYEDAEAFSQGLAPVQLNGRWGYINEGGMNVIPASYQYAGVFQENGLALVRSEGFYGYINSSGEMVIPAAYDSASAFSSAGMALVSKNGLYGYIDATGNAVIALNYTYLGPFYSGLAPAKTQEQFGYIDTTGAFVIQPKYEYAEAFSQDGVAKVTVTGKYMFINTKGEPITETAFSKAGTFQNGYAVVTVDGKQGLLKPDGTYAIAPGEYGFPKPVCEELLVFRDPAGLYGYMDTAGTVVIPAQFTDAQSFRKDGFAAVEKDGKWGIVDKTGSWIADARFEEIK